MSVSMLRLGVFGVGVDGGLGEVASGWLFLGVAEGLARGGVGAGEVRGRRVSSSCWMNSWELFSEGSIVV